MSMRPTLSLVFATALTTAAAQSPLQLRATEEMRISGDAHDGGDCYRRLLPPHVMTAPATPRRRICAA